MVKILVLLIACSVAYGQGRQAALMPHLENIIKIARHDRTTSDKDTLDAIAEACESAETEVSRGADSNWSNVKVSVKGYTDRIVKLTGNLKDKSIASKVTAEVKSIQAVK